MKKLIPLFLAGIVIFAIISPLFIKVQMKCRSQLGPCPDDINSELKGLNNKNLYAVKHRVSKILYKKFIVSKFSSQFKLPNIVEVNLLLKRPIYNLYDSNSAIFGSVDPNGQIIAISKTGNLPTVITQKELKIGENITEKQSFALKLIQGVHEMYQVQKGEIIEDRLTVELPGPVTIIFPLSGDVQVLLGELRLTFDKLKSNELAGKFREIDLRFRDPVLR